MEIVNILKTEFQKRVQKNPKYSLRAYAQFLGLNAAELSMVFRGQRNLSIPSAKKVAQALDFSAEQTLTALNQLQLAKTGINFIDEAPPEAKAHQEQIHLNLEKFKQISQWYHFAILNLTETKDFQWNSKHIGQRLGLSSSVVQMAMDDLTAAGLIQLSKKSKTIKADPRLPSPVIKNYHKQMLEKAIFALQEVPLDYREYQSVGMVIRKRDLGKIKSEIDQFTDSLIEKYHKADSEHVYQLQVALFPLTREILS